jgi:hypothetical protein
MESEFTNSRLSKKLGISLTKVRRLAKDFLPPDPEATRQSGKTRKYGKNEAFDIYLGHHLITRMKFRTDEAKAIHKDISPWMHKAGIYPETGPDFEPDDWIDYEKTDGNVEDIPIVYPTIIYIMVANTESGFFYEITKIVDEKSKKLGGKTFYTRTFVKDLIVPPPKNRELVKDDLNLRVLNLAKLRDDFDTKILMVLVLP